MPVHYPETIRRYEHYRKKDEVIIIKYGAEWCGPCKSIMPVFKKLAKDYPHVYFLDIDIDNDVLSEHEDLKDIRKVPTIRFYIKKELIKEIVGGDSERLKRYANRYSLVNIIKT